MIIDGYRLEEVGYLVNAKNLLGILSMLLIIIIKYTIFNQRRLACLESSSNSRSREFALFAQLLSIREEQISTYVRLVRFEIWKEKSHGNGSINNVKNPNRLDAQ
jgi:hypothetical protein